MTATHESKASAKAQPYKAPFGVIEDREMRSLRRSGANASAILVFVALRVRARRNGDCVDGLRSLAQLTGHQTRTVTTALDWLIRNGVVVLGPILGGRGRGWTQSRRALRFEEWPENDPATLSFDPDVMPIRTSRGLAEDAPDVVPIAQDVVPIAPRRGAERAPSISKPNRTQTGTGYAPQERGARPPLAPRETPAPPPPPWTDVVTVDLRDLPDRGTDPLKGAIASRKTATGRSR